MKENIWLGLLMALCMAIGASVIVDIYKYNQRERMIQSMEKWERILNKVTCESNVMGVRHD